MVRRGIERAVCIQNVDHRQVLPLAHLVVVGVVAGVIFTHPLPSSGLAHSSATSGSHDPAAAAGACASHGHVAQLDELRQQRAPPLSELP